jgi:hypothetical protein
MNIIERFNRLYTDPEGGLAYRTFNAGVTLATVGIATIVAGGAAEAAGSKEGFGVVLAGLTVDYLGGLALIGGAVGIYLTGEDPS